MIRSAAYVSHKMRVSISLPRIIARGVLIFPAANCIVDVVDDNRKAMICASNCTLRLRYAIPEVACAAAASVSCGLSLNSALQPLHL